MRGNPRVVEIYGVGLTGICADFLTNVGFGTDSTCAVRPHTLNGVRARLGRTSVAKRKTVQIHKLALLHRLARLSGGLRGESALI